MTSEEEWEYYRPFIEEAERDIAEGRILTEKEFWALVDEEEKKERRERLSNYKRKNLDILKLKF